MIEPQYTKKFTMIDRILDKVMSARFLVTLLIVRTFCILVENQQQIPTDFAILATMIVSSYFGKTDRKQKEN